MTKKELEWKHLSELKDKDIEIEQLEDKIITLIQSPSHVRVKYEAPWNDKTLKGDQSSLKLSLRPFGFERNGIRNTTKTEDYPELLSNLEKAMKECDHYVKGAYCQLGHAQAIVSEGGETAEYELEKIPELERNAVAYKALGEATHGAFRILERRIEQATN